MTNFKPIALAMLCVVLILTLSTGTVAVEPANPNNLTEDDLGLWGDAELAALAVSGSQDSLGALKLDTGLNAMESILAAPLRGVAWAIFNLPGFQSIDELVFSQSEHPPEIGGVFYQGEWDMIIWWWRLFLVIALSGAVIGLIVSGAALRIISAAGFGNDPRQRAESMEMLWNIVPAVLFAVFTPLLATILFELNEALVITIKDALATKGIVDLGLGVSSLAQMKTTSPLLDAMVQVAYAGLSLFMNFIYLVRKIVIGVLVVVMPLISWAWLSRGTRTPLLLALTEIASNAFMSASHAVALAFYFSIVHYSQVGLFSAWWAKLFAITLVIPVAALLRRLIAGWLNLLGVNEEKWAGLATAGLGGLVGLASVLGSGAAAAGKAGTAGLAAGGLAAAAAGTGTGPRRPGGDDGFGGNYPGPSPLAAGGFATAPPDVGTKKVSSEPPGSSRATVNELPAEVRSITYDFGSSARHSPERPGPAAAPSSSDMANLPTVAGTGDMTLPPDDDDEDALDDGKFAEPPDGAEIPVFPAVSRSQTPATSRSAAFWDTATRIGAGFGQVSGALAGIAIGGPTAEAFTRFGGRIGRGSVAGAQRMAGAGMAGVRRVGKMTLDRVRWTQTR